MDTEQGHVTILVVGEEELFADFLERFPAESYTVVLAKTLEEVPELCSREQPSLVVVDVTEETPELVTALREVRQSGHTVLGLTKRARSTAAPRLVDWVLRRDKGVEVTAESVREILAERRHWPRVVLELPIKLGDGTGDAASASVVSGRSLFVPTKKPRPVGETLRLTVEEKGGGTLTCQALVVRVGRGSTGQDGMVLGVPQDAGKVRKFLDRIVRRALELEHAIHGLPPAASAAADAASSTAPDSGETGAADAEGQEGSAPAAEGATEESAEDAAKEAEVAAAERLIKKLKDDVILLKHEAFSHRARLDAAMAAAEVEREAARRERGLLERQVQRLSQELLQRAALEDLDETTDFEDEVTSVPHHEVTSVPHDEVTSARDQVTSVPHDEVTSVPHDEITSVPHDEVTSVPEGVGGPRRAKIDDRDARLLVAVQEVERLHAEIRRLKGAIAHREASVPRDRSNPSLPRTPLAPPPSSAAPAGGLDADGWDDPFAEPDQAADASGTTGPPSEAEPLPAAPGAPLPAPAARMPGQAAPPLTERLHALRQRLRHDDIDGPSAFDVDTLVKPDGASVKVADWGTSGAKPVGEEEATQVRPPSIADLAQVADAADDDGIPLVEEDVELEENGDSADLAEEDEAPSPSGPLGEPPPLSSLIPPDAPFEDALGEGDADAQDGEMPGLEGRALQPTPPVWQQRRYQLLGVAVVVGLVLIIVVVASWGDDETRSELAGAAADASAAQVASPVDAAAPAPVGATTAADAATPAFVADAAVLAVGGDAGALTPGDDAAPSTAGLDAATEEADAAVEADASAEEDRTAAPAAAKAPRPLSKRARRQLIIDRGKRLMAKGKQAAARRELTRAMKMGDDSYVRQLLAQSHQRSGERWAAVYHLQKAAAKSRGKRRARLEYQLGTLYVGLRQRAKACQAFGAAVRANPRHRLAVQAKARHCR